MSTRFARRFLVPNLVRTVALGLVLGLLPAPSLAKESPVKARREVRVHRPDAKRVSVAGDWNEWCGSSRGAFDASIGAMESLGEGLWRFGTKGLAPGRHEYKLIVDGNWEGGANRLLHVDDEGRVFDPYAFLAAAWIDDLDRVELRFADETPPDADLEIRFDPPRALRGKTRVGKHVLRLDTDRIDLRRRLRVHVAADGEKGEMDCSPREVFRRHFLCRGPLGPTFLGPGRGVRFAVFAPRAGSVELLLGDRSDGSDARAAAMHPLEDGSWELVVPRARAGQFYRFRVDGPKGTGEAFDPSRLRSDPYARANVNHDGPSILVPPGATDEAFRGWTDAAFRTPPREDLVICEIHVRDMTRHESSHVPPALRGGYLGLAASAGGDTGLGHLERLGVNAVELLPVHEFDETPPGSYHWGYMSSLYFAPESSYASAPTGRQVTEFKALVNRLHERGFAVILDVVYNHTGEPHHLSGFDRKYYYRLDERLGNLNFSGCGNDVQSESPMAARLIGDSICHFIEEYHVDGFRFDLAELIDLDTLRAVETRARALKPDVLLIAEPWSFRGQIKGAMKGTSWAYWNDDFRNRVKAFARGDGNAGGLDEVLGGSVRLWAETPLHSVNYLESHDDRTLADDLSRRPDHDGRLASPEEIARNRLGALLLFTSLGIPMIAQGQDFGRSKGGMHNSHDAGDAVNAIDWTFRSERPGLQRYHRDLIRFRLSSWGRSLRPKEAVGPEWIRRLDHGRKTLAWVINPEGKDGAAPICCFVNACKGSREFHLPERGAPWRLVGSLKHVLDRPSSRSLEGGHRLLLGPLSARIYVGSGLTP